MLAHLIISSLDLLESIRTKKKIQKEKNRLMKILVEVFLPIPLYLYMANVLIKIIYK